MELHKFNTKYSIYWDRLCQKNYDEGCWKMNCEDYSDYFLQKYLDDSFKSEILKVLFEKDPLTEDEKKKILNSMYLESFLLSTAAHVNSLFFSNLCLSLAAGADVNSRILDNSSEPSPLHVLSMDKSKKVMLMMDILLTHPNIQVNVKDRSEFQKTPLMIACLYGSAEAFSKLCRHPNIDLNCRDTHDHTALHWAFIATRDMHLVGKIKILEKIFDPDSSNFDIEVKNNNGENVIEILLRNRYSWLDYDWIWELLFQHPAICRMVNFRNKEGYTLLFRAIEINQLRAAKFLLKHSNSSLAPVNSDGRSVVQVAVDHWITYRITEGVEDCLRLFSEHLAVRRMLNNKNKDGDTPIIQLLKHGRLDLVNVLLESPEIDLDVRDSNGNNLETIAR